MPDDVLKILEDIAQTDSIERHYDDDENYVGSTVTYTNPQMPELKTVYHPYVPLQVVKAVEEQVIPVEFNTRYGNIKLKEKDKIG